MTTLALLVGTNPLPNLVTACWWKGQLRPEDLGHARVHLYYTNPRQDVPGDVGTESVAARLKTAIESSLGPNTATLKDLPSPVEVVKIRDEMVKELKAVGPSIHVS